jgi:outer membrane lipoprotein-sorting protein
MKKLLSLLLIGTLGFTGMAQDEADQSEKAKKILDEISAESKTYKSLSVDFQLVVKGGEINSSQSGTAKIKGGKYFYETEDRKVYSDGEKVWTYLVEENECYIDLLEDLDGGINPSEILNIWEDNFKFQYSKEISANVHEIKLFPKDTKNSKYHTVIVTVDSQKKRITKAIIKTKENVMILFTVKKLTPNVDISDGTFKWNPAKFKGVQEIENF